MDMKRGNNRHGQFEEAKHCTFCKERKTTLKDVDEILYNRAM
jgi:hypothetical protein